MRIDIAERCLELSIKVIKSAESLNYSVSSKIVIHQLIRSTTSIGANITEAQAGSSKKDFTNYYCIALKSSKETIYWLRLLKAISGLDLNIYNELVDEVTQISKIIGASIIKLKN